MNRLSSTPRGRRPSSSVEVIQQRLVVMPSTAVAAGVTAPTTVASAAVALRRFSAAKGMFRAVSTAKKVEAAGPLLFWGRLHESPARRRCEGALFESAALAGHCGSAP